MTSTETAPTLRREGDNRLPELASRIKAGHQEISDALKVKGLVPKAYQVGLNLKEAKDKVGHGGWAKWLKENCNLSERSASRYMKIASNKSLLEDKKKAGTTLADMTLSDADKIIAKAAKKAPADAQKSGGGKADGDGKDEGSDNPPSVDQADKFTNLEDKVVAAFKELKKDDEDAAQTYAASLVKRLRDLDLIDD
jgi:hypothetical protein